MKQTVDAYEGISSAKLQRWNGTVWVDVQTLTLALNNLTQTFNITTSVSGNKWRLLANANTLGCSWRVYEIEMFEPPYSPSGTYTSPIINVSSADIAKNSSISWNSTTPNETSFTVQTNTSLNNVWQGWKTVSNGAVIPDITDGTDLTNAKLQYKISLSTANNSITPQFHDITLNIEGRWSTLPEGKISHLFINSSYCDINGTTTSLSNKYSLSSSQPTKIVISGNGNKLFYPNPSFGGRLYLLDLTSGNDTEISSIVPVDIKVNYDGTKAAFKDFSNNLYFYNGATATLITGSVADFQIQTDGSLCYYKSDNSTLYYPTNTVCLSGQSISHVDIARTTNQIVYSNTNSIYSLNLTPAGWKSSLLTTASKNIEAIKTNKDGTTVYFKTADGVFSYQLPSKALRRLDTSASVIVKVTDDNKLVIQDPNFKYQIYDPDSDASKDIRPSDAKNPPVATNVLFDVDDAGSKMVYVSNTDLSIYYFNGVKKPDRYLLSFDGKNSWCSYSDGVWIPVKSGELPVKEDFDNYGMTVDEVNALSESDFESLYTDGRQIFNFDIAVYFSSVHYTVTPSIKNITITLNGGELSSNGELLEPSLYVKKEQKFDSTTWREIRKIYPIEIQPKEAEMYYFIVKDNVYKSYKNGAWIDNIDPNLLTDVEANWIDSTGGQGITQIGMTAEELRAIPEAALNTLLPANNISVVYAMKVQDASTEQYSSLITIDYVENLFSASTVTLTIAYINGSTAAYALPKAQAEDFMTWVNERQNNRGPIFYRLKTGTVDIFINYYTIQTVGVS